MNVLMISSEMTPYIKTGGLADVVGALPVALQRRGNQVAVVLPLYGDIDTGRFPMEFFHGPMGVWMGGGQEWCAVHRSFKDGVPVYFIEHNEFFGRHGLYNDRAMRDYKDNPLRFSFLARAALQLCLDKGFRPDVVHAHDWQTALAPAYLRTWNWHNSVLDNVRSLLTIHNLAYQGLYHKSNYPYFGIGWDHFTFNKFEHDDAINLLKGGIYFADVVNTVSPTYAHEITSPQRGYGLDGNLRMKGDHFGGILNGADYDVWSPEHDHYLPHHYDIDNRHGKWLNRRLLQQHFGLHQDDNVPIFGVVGRFAAQKGYGLLASVLEPMLNNMYMQFVILGTGEKDLEVFYNHMAHKYGDMVGAHIGFSEDLAHLIEAGSDFFIMPSLFEPCGLNQMYSLRYGTLPIVRATGGLNDTVENYDQNTGGGTGFKFYDFSAHALYHTVEWAVATYFDRKHHMESLIRNAMSRRFTWDMSAEQYEHAYRVACGW
ncbi:MAG: glycogen synthase GlgA [Candidatus Eremiobacteraeota bacterium]|nr:glycogen synthase GlgA [Candidatus Eremiobacteraeota bacterium]